LYDNDHVSISGVPIAVSPPGDDHHPDEEEEEESNDEDDDDIINQLNSLVLPR